MSIAHFSAFRTVASQEPGRLDTVCRQANLAECIARHLAAIGQLAWTGQLPRLDQNNELNVLLDRFLDRTSGVLAALTWKLDRRTICAPCIAAFGAAAQCSAKATIAGKSLWQSQPSKREPGESGCRTL